MATRYREHDIDAMNKGHGLWAAKTKHNGRDVTRFGATKDEAVSKVKEYIKSVTWRDLDEEPKDEYETS